MEERKNLNCDIIFEISAYDAEDVLYENFTRREIKCIESSFTQEAFIQKLREKIYYNIEVEELLNDALESLLQDCM